MTAQVYSSSMQNQRQGDYCKLKFSLACIVSHFQVVISLQFFLLYFINEVYILSMKYENLKLRMIPLYQTCLFIWGCLSLSWYTHGWWWYLCLPNNMSMMISLSIFDDMVIRATCAHVFTHPLPEAPVFWIRAVGSLKHSVCAFSKVSEELTWVLNGNPCLFS